MIGYGFRVRVCLAYKTLEIDESISDDALKAQYKTLLKIYHPDKNPGDPNATAFATEKLKKINSAYDEIKKYRKDNFNRHDGARRSRDQERPDRNEG